MPIGAELVKQLFAQAGRYHHFMKMDTRKVLAANVRALMALHPAKNSNAKLAGFCKTPTRNISARTIGYLLDTTSTHSPQLDTIIAVAEAFGVEPWKLMHPEFSAASPKRSPEFLSKEESVVLGKIMAKVGISDLEVEKHQPAVAQKQRHLSAVKPRK